MRSLLATVILVGLVAACSAADVVLGMRGRAEPDQQRSAAGAAGARTDGGSSGTAVPVPGTSGRTSAGCGKPLPNEENRIELNGASGSYVIDLPPTYDARQPIPLLFAFRASENTVASFRETLDLGRVAGRDAIIVHPDYLNGADVPSLSRDVPYFDELLSRILERYCADPARVFVVGHAQGGMLASEIACQHPDRVRAGALFAGTTPLSSCGGAVAMFIAQGTMDMIYPLRAGRGTRDFWLRRNQCDSASSEAADPPPCVDYAGCSAGAPVRYCEYGGGHELPGFAASAVWSFFEALQ